MIKILNPTFDRLGVIKNAISSNRLEEINGENALDFNAVLNQKLNNFIDENSVFELDDDWFDTAYLKKTANEDNTFTVEVEADHISYRLNKEEYNVEFFTEIGEPTYILGKILEGTGFTVGTVEFSGSHTYSAQEAKSRRQLLMEFVAYLGGEVQFNKFAVSIVIHRGSSVTKPVIKDRNVKVVSKTVNKRTLDDTGNPLTSYTCTPIYLPGDDYSLGDNIILMQKELGINENLRVVSINRDVYDSMNVTFQFANYVNGLESSLYRISTISVAKDKLYNGIRIGPEYGFEAIRNDKKARAYFRSDGMKFQSGDGSGTTWKDRLYYEYDSETDETILVLDGRLSADMINALSAVITPNLYAENGTIAELTVDSLDTNPKVRNYLRGDTSEVNYCQMTGQIIQFITGQIISTYGAARTGSGTWDMTADIQTATYYSNLSVKDSTGTYSLYGGITTDAFSAYQSGRIYRAIDSTSYYKITGISNLGFVYYDVYTIGAVSTNYEQLKNRKGNLMYWVDETHEAATENETTFPVYVYLYNEFIKLELTFEYDGTNHIPKITLGAGTGVEGHPSYGKGYIYKGATGLYIEYLHSVTGQSRIIKLTDEGIDLTDFEAIKYSETIAITGLPQIWVQDEEPANAKAKDVWVHTDEYSRYDVATFTVSSNDLVSNAEVVIFTGATALTYTLSSTGATAGCIKKLKNRSTAIITVAATIDGVANMYLYPKASVELIYNGTDWSVM